jgi:phospholipid transport system transporter-binding protein
MIRVAGGQVEVSGPMTMAGAAAMLAEGEAAIAADASVFDLAAVTELDSSSLAVIFGWMRAARDGGKVVKLLNLPQNLLSLAEVYGVSDLLPQP